MTRRSIHHRLLSFLSVIGGLCFLLSDCEKTEVVAPDVQIPAQSQTIFSSGISFEPGQGQSKSVSFTATAKRKAQRRNYVEKEFIPLAAPVVIEGDWREMAKR